MALGVPNLDQKSPRLVKLIVEELTPMFGVPEAILSDRGANLFSHLMMDTCKLVGDPQTQHDRISPAMQWDGGAVQPHPEGYVKGTCGAVWKPVGHHAPWSVVCIPEYTS